MAKLDTGLGATSCCGLYELQDVSLLNTYEECLYSLGKLNESRFWPYLRPSERKNAAYQLLFTDVVTIRPPRRLRGGLLMVSFLKKLGVGTLVEGPVGKNPNTGNRLASWIYRLPEGNDWFNQILNAYVEKVDSTPESPSKGKEGLSA